MPEKSFQVLIFTVILAGVLGAIHPVGYVITIAPILFVFFHVYSVQQICNHLWIILIIALFFGAYLSIPGYDNYYLFRLILPIQCLFFLMNNKLDFYFMKINQVYVILLTLWILSGLLSLFIANDINLGFRYLSYMLEICYLFLLSVFYINKENAYKEVAKVILVIYHIAIIIGLVEVTTGWHMRLSSAYVYVTTTIKYQPTGFLYNPNDYALLLCILFPLVIVYIDDHYGNKIKWIWKTSITVLTVFLVISTYSRIGMISLFLSLLLLIIYRFRKNSIYILGIILSVLYMYCICTSTGKELFEKIYISFTDKGTSTTARTELYSTLWEIIRDTNFVGVGAGNMPLELTKYLLGYTQVDGGYTTGHNFWLESLGNIGLLGFIILVIVMFIYFYNSVYVLLNVESRSLIVIVPLLIGISFVGSSIALSTILEKRFLWFLLWIGVCLMKNIKKSRRSYKNEANEVQSSM